MTETPALLTGAQLTAKGLPVSLDYAEPVEAIGPFEALSGDRFEIFGGHDLAHSRYPECVVSYKRRHGSDQIEGFRKFTDGTVDEAKRIAFFFGGTIIDGKKSI
jgi:hypothetical protein